MEIKGTIIKVGELETYKNDFTKKSVVLKTEEKYPQELQIDFIKDNIRKIDTIQVGNKVTIGYNLRGRKYTKDGVDKWFTSIEGWIVTYHEKVDTPSKPEPVVEIDNDDLPF